MATFNYKEITRKIASSAIGAKRVNTVMQNKFETEKTNLLSSFDNHPVTKEIESKEGDFYGLLGFERSSDPIKPVREVLDNDLKLISTGVPIAKSGNKVSYKFSLRIPTERLKSASPMPWESGRSWLYAVEKDGISGFSRFLSALKEKSGAFKAGRSKRGLQAKNDIAGRPDEYPVRSYLFDMIGKMVKDLRGRG